MASPRVSIAGVGLSDLGRVPDKTATQLLWQGARRALADCGLTKDDIDGFGAHGTTLAPVEVSEQLGLRPEWFDGTNVGGSSWEVMAQHTMEAIQAGSAEVVLLAYGSTARSDAKRQNRGTATAVNRGGPLAFDNPYGHTLIAKYRDGCPAAHAPVRHHRGAARRDCCGCARVGDAQP